jgi:PAS domain S-box-containing protein
MLSRFSNAVTSYSPLRRCVELFAVYITYILAGEIGLAGPFTSGNVSPVWPAAGVALASILIFGYRVAPAIVAGAFTVNYFSSIPHLAAAGLAAGNTGAALLGAHLLQRFDDFGRSLSRLRDVVRLIIFAAGVSSIFSASVGTVVLFATRVRPWTDIGTAWTVYWLGDAMGVLLVAPLLLTFSKLLRVRNFRMICEAVVLVLLTAAGCLLIFTNASFHNPEPQMFAFVVFPFVIWAAIRFGVAGAALATLLIANVAISSTVLGYGPFSRHTPFVNAALLQIYLGVLTISGLLLSGAIAERETLIRDQSQREARLQLAAIVDSSGDAIISLRVDGTIASWNSGAERLYGYAANEAVGKPLYMLMAPDRSNELAAIMNVLTAGSAIHQLETVRQRKDRSRLDVSLSISPIRNTEGAIVGAADIARDITEKKLAEEALRRADRLATTGRLAATIAHEINNPLESLTNLLYLIQTNSSLDESARKYARAADDELQRTSYITRQMLSFHRGSENAVSLDLAELLDSVVHLYSPLIAKRGINVQRRYDDHALVTGTQAEFRQIFANLVRNAIEAVAVSGTITLRIRKSQFWKGPSKSGVRVVIADNGRGIARELQSKIFEPFFTTKGENGTGLGLWVGSGIIQKRDGSIRFRSSTRPGRSGTVFSVFLPISAAPGDSGRLQRVTRV